MKLDKDTLRTWGWQWAVIALAFEFVLLIQHGWSEYVVADQWKAPALAALVLAIWKCLMRLLLGKAPS